MSFFMLFETFRAHAPQMIDRQVAGQSKKPRLEISAGIEARDLPRHAQPGLLKQILGFGGLAHDAQQIAIQPVLVARHQLRKRVQVSASKPGDFGFETHQHLHRNGSVPYHTVLYTDEVCKRTHGAPESDGASALHLREVRDFFRGHYGGRRRRSKKTPGGALLFSSTSPCDSPAVPN